MSIFNKIFGKNNNVDNYIQYYDKALSGIQCKSLIDCFESSEAFQVPGGHYHGSEKLIAPEVKESTEIYISPEFGEDKVWGPCVKPVLIALSDSMKKYVKRYTLYDGEDLDNWRGAAGLDGISQWGMEPNFNFQRFKPNQGYKKWHCETSNVESSPRVLVWMIYLNDVPDGGTDFLNNDTMEAIEGRLVIWPPYWTHFHKSQVSKKTTKYILTGWFRYL